MPFPPKEETVMENSNKKHGYLPSREADILKWSRENLAYLKQHETRLKISASGLDALILKREVFAEALEKARRRNHCKDDTIEKNASKKDFIGSLRVYMKCNVLYNPLLKDTDKEKLELNISKKREQAPVPSSFP
jgi:hypothetical protein